MLPPSLEQALGQWGGSKMLAGKRKGRMRELRGFPGDYPAKGPGGVLPYMGYIGMCGPKGYSFLAVLVINRVSIAADCGHFGHK